jgi:hypothetical protein
MSLLLVIYEHVLIGENNRIVDHTGHNRLGLVEKVRLHGSRRTKSGRGQTEYRR